MKPYKELCTRLKSFVVFRPMLETEVIKKLLELLEYDGEDKACGVDLYCDFASALYSRAGSVADWILDYITDDVNIYIKACIHNAPQKAMLEQCARQELQTLTELAALDGETVAACLGYDGFLPSWEGKSIDFCSLYQTQINQISTKGYGIFAKYHIFTVENGALVPVHYPDTQSLESLYGYETERNKVIANTKALLKGIPANNVLLYGDAGTGKSATVKAIANAFKDEGLRLVEVKKNQLYQLPLVMETLSESPLKYIIFIDDLSFSADDNDFAALKAILEGSVGGRSTNIAVYATSNRRRLVKETHSDRDGDDLHQADTMQETMSLSARFGLTVTYLRPDKMLYGDIVCRLAEQEGINMEKDSLLIKAEAHAIRNGGRSPRVAKQFIDLLKAGV